MQRRGSSLCKRSTISSLNCRTRVSGQDEQRHGPVFNNEFLICSPEKSKWKSGYLSLCLPCFITVACYKASFLSLSWWGSRVYYYLQSVWVSLSFSAPNPGSFVCPRDSCSPQEPVLCLCFGFCFPTVLIRNATSSRRRAFLTQIIKYFCFLGGICGCNLSILLCFSQLHRWCLYRELTKTGTWDKQTSSSSVMPTPTHLPVTSPGSGQYPRQHESFNNWLCETVRLIPWSMWILFSNWLAAARSNRLMHTSSGSHF